MKGTEDVEWIINRSQRAVPRDLNQPTDKSGNTTLQK